MNIYRYHTEPSSLLHHDAAHDSVPKLFWEKHKYNPAELKRREAAIAVDPKYAYLYAKNILKSPFPKGEAAIAKDANYAYLYAREVLKANFYYGDKLTGKM